MLACVMECSAVCAWRRAHTTQSVFGDGNTSECVCACACVCVWTNKLQIAHVFFTRVHAEVHAGCWAVRKNELNMNRQIYRLPIFFLWPHCLGKIYIFCFGDRRYTFVRRFADGTQLPSPAVFQLVKQGCTSQYTTMGKKTSGRRGADREGGGPPPAPPAPVVAPSASKRQRSSDDAAVISKKVAPHATTGGGGSKGGNVQKGKGEKEEEEEEDLMFEDPFGDEFDPEDIDAMNTQQEREGDDGDEEEEQDAIDSIKRDAAGAMDVIPEGAAAGAAQGETKVWRAGVDELAEGDELEYDSTAYHMYHSLRPEWPCLSFDVIRDSLGTNRSRFPHTVFAVAGTQADRAESNRLQVCLSVCVCLCACLCVCLCVCL